VITSDKHDSPSDLPATRGYQRNLWSRVFGFTSPTLNRRRRVFRVLAQGEDHSRRWPTPGAVGKVARLAALYCHVIVKRGR
jgi:hypothetical protein